MTLVGPTHYVLYGGQDGRILLQPRGAARWRCGLVPDVFWTLVIIIINFCYSSKVEEYENATCVWWSIIFKPTVVIVWLILLVMCLSVYLCLMLVYCGKHLNGLSWFLVWGFPERWEPGSPWLLLIYCYKFTSAFQPWWAIRAVTELWFSYAVL